MTPPTERPGPALAHYARECIRHALGGPRPSPPADLAAAGRLGATFVTLRRDGELHGCIGTLVARRPLVEDVAANAVAAALEDPRALPLSLAEVDDLDVEVSILSPLEPIAFASEADALRALRPGVDGALLRWGRRQGTFLPQVWESLPDPAEFFANLKLKAGLSPDFWAPGMELYRYTVEKIGEPAVRARASMVSA